MAAPIDAASASYVGTLTHQALDNTWAPWIATDSYSTPVYRVPADQTTVKVTLDIPYAPLQNEWLQVPVPPDARPAAGTDKHMVVYQASTDTMWEFWLMDRATDGWHARWGGRITNFSKSPGYYEGADKWNGATATSLPMVGGLITVDELRNKKIEHALALAIPEASTRAVWPAQRGDGTSNAADAIPSGTRFRIKRSVNVEALPVSEVTKVIARAAQTYGLVVRDTTASSVSLAAEMQSTPGPDIYARPNGLLGSQWQSEIMRSIPWRDMEAIAPPQ